MVEKKSTKAKSTPKKRAVKVEGPKLESETHQALNLFQENINWSSLALSSTFTLILTAVLFIVGWAYESNWYGFFGINMSQINSQPQQILIYSLPTILIILLIVSMLVAFAIYIKNSLEPQQWSLTDIEWLMLFTFLNWILAFTVYRLVAAAYDQPLFFANNEFTRILPVEIYSSLAEGMLYMSISLLLTILFVWKYRHVKETDLKWLNELGRKLSSNLKRLWLTTVAFTLFIQTLGLSAAYGAYDARSGRKRVGGYVQNVFLVSPKRLGIIQDLEYSCDENSCTYGPLGLVAESAQAYYMIVWNDDEIPYHPGLFLFPRNDQNEPYVVIPASAANNRPVATSLPTLGVLPTFISTTTPTLRPLNTPVPEITPTSVQP